MRPGSGESPPPGHVLTWPFPDALMHGEREGSSSLPKGLDPTVDLLGEPLTENTARPYSNRLHEFSYYRR